MSVEVLVSTMYSNIDIVKDMNIYGSCTIINQCDIDNFETDIQDKKKNKIYIK